MISGLIKTAPIWGATLVIVIIAFLAVKVDEREQTGEQAEARKLERERRHRRAKMLVRGCRGNRR